MEEDNTPDYEKRKLAELNGVKPEVKTKKKKEEKED